MRDKGDSETTVAETVVKLIRSLVFPCVGRASLSLFLLILTLPCFATFVLPQYSYYGKIPMEGLKWLSYRQSKTYPHIPLVLGYSCLINLT